MKKSNKYTIELEDERYKIRDNRLIGQPVVAEFNKKTPAQDFCSLLNGLIKSRKCFMLFLDQLGLPGILMKPNGNDLLVDRESFGEGEGDLIVGVCSNPEVATKVADKLNKTTRSGYRVLGGYVSGYYPITKKQLDQFEKERLEILNTDLENEEE